MTTRTEIKLKYRVGGRVVEIRAFDSVGVEDAYENQIKGVLHRYATGEDWIQPVPREVKDFIIRTSLFV